MADSRERRQRRPKRPAVYLALVAVCAVSALGSALDATRSPGEIKVLWQGAPQFVSQGKARDVGAAAP